VDDEEHWDEQEREAAAERAAAPQPFYRRLVSATAFGAAADAPIARVPTVVLQTTNATLEDMFDSLQFRFNWSPPANATKSKLDARARREKARRAAKSEQQHTRRNRREQRRRTHIAATASATAAAAARAAEAEADGGPTRGRHRRFLNFIASAGDFFDGIGTVVVDIANDFGETVVDLVDDVGEVLEDIVETVEDVVETVVDFTEDVIDTIGDALDGFEGELTQTFNLVNLNYNHDTLSATKQNIGMFHTKDPLTEEHWVGVLL
jgi:hypothetical protein